MTDSCNDNISISPLVSIITPTYNQASYLDETILSILNQDYARTEYIVIDDGSTDNTIEVLQKYDGKLIWQTQPNQGETIAVNRGWGMAHGDITTVVNSDDPLLPGAISSAVAFMELYPDVLVAYPDWYIIGPDSKVKQHVQVPEYDYITTVKYHKCFIGPGAFIRRSAFESAGMRDPDFKYVADLEFWLRLGLYGKFARIPRTLATWREHSGGISQSCKSVAMAEEHIRLTEKLFSRADLPPEVLGVKGEALCWAYGVAALTCGSGTLLPIKYFYRAFLCDPSGFFRAISIWRSWRIALSSLVFNPISKFISNVRHFITPKMIL